jgi:hypothetical protein
MYLKLEEGAESIHLKPYPVARAHKQVFLQELK